MEVVRAVLKERNRRVRFNSVSNAVEALEYMRRSGKYTDAPLPDVTILDLNEDEGTGIEFLGTRAAHPVWHISPILVLVSATEMMRTCYTLRATACIRKPQSSEELARLVEHIEVFWCRTVMLPPPEVRLRELVGTVGG
jgi:CheY-like chemotaxis protein